jgi:hypothetical protein
MAEAMIAYVKGMKAVCAGWNVDCRLRSDIDDCEASRGVKCPEVRRKHS